MDKNSPLRNFQGSRIETTLQSLFAYNNKRNTRKYIQWKTQKENK
jgi:hypothetical protein